MILMTTPYHKTTFPGGHEIYNFGILGIPSVDHHYYILSSRSWEQERRFKRNNAFSVYELYGHALAQEPMKFAILVESSLFIVNMYILFVWSMSRNREEDF